MLTSIAASTVVSTTAASSCSVVSMITNTGQSEYSILAVAAIIILLFVKEILSASERWNKATSCSLNMCISTLFFSFVAIVAYTIYTSL